MYRRHNVPRELVLLGIVHDIVWMKYLHYQVLQVNKNHFQDVWVYIHFVVHDNFFKYKQEARVLFLIFVAFFTYYE